MDPRVSNDRRKPNRLIREKSPYLLQHAHNPVDWYPWGEEAFEKARREDKPILLSIGYSTCHWCHVMERESFEDPAAAAVMNEYLVCIKLDREERPDVDKIYMTAVMALTGSGGWPLNVFLTPDREPFFGGTYFPPDGRWGRPGWVEVVRRVGDAWRDPDQRRRFLDSGKSLTDALRGHLAAPRAAAATGLAALDAAYEDFRASFDAAQGGFSPAPKFPMPANINFLLRYHASAKGRKDRAEAAGEALRMTLETLRAIARGGIHDHVGGGFHRYSTDERWHVPHFEKMLYDNAQLAVNYLEAYQIARDDDFARVARETLDYVRRDMTHPEGGFYSAEDADSLPGNHSLPAEGATAPSSELRGPAAAQGAGHSAEKKEGAFYVWEKKEIDALLGADAAAFEHAYGVESGGNAREDPHGEFPDKNILYLAHTSAETAARLKRPEKEVEDILARGRAALFAARAERPRPHLDDKVLASWNGLMISAFAKGAQVLDDAAYRDAAVRAAEFLRKNLYDEKERRLYRRWRDGERAVPGTADDYAFLAQGLLDLYEASFDPRWLEWAVELTEVLNERFQETARGGYFMTEAGADDKLLMRVVEDTDNVEPSASSVTALNLLRLARITDRKDFRETAGRTLNAFGDALETRPRALPQMLAALDVALGRPMEIILVGDADAPAMRAMLRVIHNRFLPQAVVAVLDDGPRRKAPATLNPFFGTLTTKPGVTTAYVCENYACRLPVTIPAALEEQLDRR